MADIQYWEFAGTIYYVGYLVPPIQLKDGEKDHQGSCLIDRGVFTMHRVDKDAGAYAGTYKNTTGTYTVVASGFKFGAEVSVLDKHNKSIAELGLKLWGGVGGRWSGSVEGSGPTLVNPKGGVKYSGDCKLEKPAS